MKSIVIKSPGLLTTVQDQGRAHLQHLGIPASGAMDPVSLAVANILAGNAEDAAVLECTWSGPVLEFNSSTQIALAGAVTEAKLNGYLVPMYTTIIIRPGDILDLSAIKTGARLYLAVAGGLQVDPVLESRSTYLPLRFGSMDRKLGAGDVLPLIESTVENKVVRLSADSPLSFSGQKGPKTVKLARGPQIDYFSEQAHQALVSSEYSLSPQSDRMGLRFTGSKIELVNTRPMISDGIPLGAMQITRSGQPIIMMADRQPTGGYPKIAQVLPTDLPILAQLRPGEKIKFEWQSLDNARDSYLKMKTLLNNLAQERKAKPVTDRCYRVYISGRLYQTTVIEDSVTAKRELD